MRSAAPKQKAYKKGAVREMVSVVIQALLIALLIRTFLFQPFNIPSGSMMPSLLIGDYIFVSKYSYGYSNYSFPFAPNLFEGRILSGAPQRGDIAVFNVPEDRGKDYIKRVIGLPGETIQMREGVLYINGEPVPKEYVDEIELRHADGSLFKTRRYIETLPNGVAHYTLDEAARNTGEDTPLYTVPQGHYFMMGDNRNNSSDSRFIGPVPLQHFVGKAQIVFFSIAPPAKARHIWLWPTQTRFNRLMDRL